MTAPDEILIQAAAAELVGVRTVFVGIGLPNAAANLARQTVAPDLELIYESGVLGARPSRLPDSIGDPALVSGATATMSMHDLFAFFLQGGRIEVGMLGAAQIDRWGNLNTTVIGPYAHPTTRLPGSGGACEIALNAARVGGADGSAPILRLWEYERIRGTVFQVDLWLPEDAAALAATIRVRNVIGRDVPMYWWTNAAVVATDGTRVLSPATRAFRTEYPDLVRVCPIPVENGLDVTRPANNRDAADYFFDVAASRYPWVASVEGDGTGVFHRSTPELRGQRHPVAHLRSHRNEP